ncbi:hypothetical protein ABZV15_08075 [Streptomyces sp. NPDC005246]|uniref:hypothetical protein n=1 Tax=Streptomyces sp. NPDC005246 TaxID=3156716 RepID=UPI0033A31A27
MLYSLTLYVLLVGGLVPALGFMVLHRPNDRFRLAEINASGLIYAIGFAYAASLVRALVLLGIRGASPGPWWDTVLSFGLLVAIDVVLFIRFVTYIAYLQKHPERKLPPLP